MLTDHILVRSRVRDDPSLTADAEVYEVTEADEVAPQWPVRYRLDLTSTDSPVLSCSQPGDWIVPDEPTDMFIDLYTLVELGEIAKAILLSRNYI